MNTPSWATIRFISIIVLLLDWIQRERILRLSKVAQRHHHQLQLSLSIYMHIQMCMYSYIEICIYEYEYLDLKFQPSPS